MTLCFSKAQPPMVSSLQLTTMVQLTEGTAEEVKDPIKTSKGTGV